MARRPCWDWILECTAEAQEALQGRLNNPAGLPVSTEERAETFAEYLETVQWAVSLAVLIDAPPLYNELPVSSSAITLDELRLALRKMKLGKAAGPDTHPVEFWRMVLDSDICPEGASWLLLLCNCMAGKGCPQSLALVTRCSYL